MRLFPDARLDEARAAELKSISKKAADRSNLQTRDERLKINSIVWDFVLAHDRIVYGGAALTALIGAESSGEDDQEITDIEFYSPEPGRDVVELCDILRCQRGMEFVQGREAVHVSTLTISVQFHRCCDVTFMPRQTAAAMPCIRAACGVWCVHPHVMAIDLLRMLTEPDTSYWRLEKAFSRLQLLEEHFPLSWDYVEETDLWDSEKENGIKDSLLLLLSGTAVIVGDYAATFFEERLYDVSALKEFGPNSLQVVCVDYEYDAGVIRKHFAETGLAKAETCMEAFGDLLGRSTRFVDSRGSVILELIDAFPRCVPCSPVVTEDGRRVASSLFCLATAMACHLRAFVTGDRVTLSQQSIICTRLLAGRESGGVASVAFEDFGLDHILGKTTSDMALHTKTKTGVTTKNKSWLRYNPSDRSGQNDDGARKRMRQAAFVSRTGRVKSVTTI